MDSTPAEASPHEKALRLYEAILTNTPDLAYVFDLGHRFIYANEGLLKMWGKTREEAIGKNCLELGYEPWHAAMHDREIDQVIATKAPIRGEVPFTGTFGRRFYDYVFVPVFNAAGEVEAVAGTTRDITELRQSQIALKESEERTLHALQVSKSAVWDWDFETNNIIVSSLYHSLHGMPEGTVVSHEWWLSAIHPLDRDRAWKYGTEFFEQGTEWRLAYRVDTAPGEDERWLESIGRLQRDASGKPRRFIGVTLDVTDRLRSEDALRIAQGRLTSALTAANMAAWDWDPGTNEIEGSDSLAVLFGLPPGERLEVGTAGSLLIHPEEVAQHQAIVESALRDVSHWHHEFRAIRPTDGRTIWLEERAHVLRHPESGRLSVSGLVWDITKRKELEASLLEADRRKDEFLATLAHELRNPLAPIRNAAHLLQNPDLTADQIRMARDIIGRQVTHMTRLVDDLMDVSRITLGQVTLRNDVVSLRSVLADAQESAGPLIEAQRHSLNVEIPAEVLTVNGDATRLAQVFHNLLANAAKYTPAGGQVSVRATSEGRRVKVSVSDTGIGIPLEAQRRVFQLFAQVHAGEFNASRGLGIGLALAKQLVELHGGHIEVRSRGTGTGSEFIVSLPLIEAQQRAGNDAQVEKTTVGSRHQVLVVDDNEDSAESLAVLLSVQGYTTKWTSSGEAALELIQSFQPGVVLLDIGMPGLDGYEVARRIRNLPCARDVFLIALTGWGQPEDKRRAAEAGFDHHLTKPVDPGLLATVMGMDRAVALK